MLSFILLLLSAISHATAGGYGFSYSDTNCDSLLAFFNLQLDQCCSISCLGSIGRVGGVSPTTYPECDSGFPTLATSDNVDCAAPSVSIAQNDTITDSNVCHSLTKTKGIASVWFYCDHGSGTTGAASSNTIPSSSISTKTSSSGTTSSTTSQTGVSDPTSQPSASSGSEWTRSDKIALGVGLSMGLLGAAVSIWATIWVVKRTRSRKEVQF